MPPLTSMKNGRRSSLLQHPKPKPQEPRVASASPVTNVNRELHHGARRRTSPAREFLPQKRDSSIGATSSNPRLRRGSMLEGAASRNTSAKRPPVDFSTRESKEAINQLGRVFLPVLLRTVLRRRREKYWKNGGPPRHYTAESVVAAIRASKSHLASWPLEVIQRLAEAATFRYVTPNEIVVYAGESHLSSGIVVLLYGQLEERRPESGKTRERPVHSQSRRLRHAPDVLCLMPVLCEDRTTSFFATRKNEEADLAVISSRLLWEVFYAAVHAPTAISDALRQSFRETIQPHRKEVMLNDYFPTSVVLLRSWMWPFFTPSDRVKLCRTMECQVLGVGDVLVEEGTICPYIFVVRRGALTVMVKGEALAVVEAGTAIGEVSVLFHENRNCTVVAGTVCELYALHVRNLLHRFEKYPAVGRSIVEKAMERRKQWMEEGKVRDIFGLVSILSGVPCLSHTTDLMREELAKLATIMTAPEGYRLCTASTPCTSIFIIGRGSVSLCSSISVSSDEAADATAQSTKKLDDTTATRDSLSNTRREARTTGDFFGELTLRPHLWPYDAVCTSSVDVWHLSRDDVLRVLERNRADAQAIEVCRQGILLYRTLRGEKSIEEGFDAPSATAAPRRSGSARRGSRVGLPPQPGPKGNGGKASGKPAPLRASVVLDDPSATSEVDRRDMPLEEVDWVAYSNERLEVMQQQDSQTDSSNPTASRELRPVDKDVEKAMKDKVLQFVAVSDQTSPNPADCDITGEANELQSIIVEQLLLTPTEQQSRFLRQVNDSNVRLVTEEEPFNPMFTFGFNDTAEDKRLDTWGTDESPIAVDQVMQLEDAPEMVSVSFGAPSNPLALYSAWGNSDMGASMSMRTGADAVGGEVNNEYPAWMQSGAGRSRRSTVIEETSGVFFPNQNPRMSLSRSHFVRPPSGLPISPRSHGRADHLPSRCGSAARPMSSSEPALPVSRARPTSVDFGQYNSKLNVERSVSALDRYVKIEDQNYFDSFVKVMPLQQDEIWAPGDEVSNGDSGALSMVLLLMHIRRCDHLAEDAMQRCRRPIVKASIGCRVLVRTSVMEKPTAPRWPIEKSSCISFVRRGMDIVFSVCDADTEELVVYEARLRTADIHENGGVGQRTITLTPVLDISSASGTGRRGSVTTVSADGKEVKKPYVTITMLAVTASKYKALRQYLETREDKVFVPKSIAPDITTLYFQVMTVEQLKHRVEGSVAVSFYNGGAVVQLVETPRVVPRTRTPMWPADRAFAKVEGDGGILTFDLLHKGAVIASSEATIDEIAFGGIGLRRFPLLQAHTGSVVIGQLVVNVLGANAYVVNENRSEERMIHLHLEELALSDSGFDFTPDLYVLLKDGAGAVVLRTPLLCGAYKGSWSAAEASCALPSPNLSGSSVTYTLEVYDSDDNAVVGRASLMLTKDGLSDSPRCEVALEPAGRGTVRIRTTGHPVLDLPGSFRAMTGAFSPPSSIGRLPTSDPILLVHVSGCTNLPGGPSADLQTDAIATMSIDGQKYMRTPLQEGTTAPQWPVTKASVVLRVPEIENDTRKPHRVLLSVYDGLVDEVNLIGQVLVPLRELMNSSRHSYPLFARPNEGARGSPDRTVGAIEVRTTFGFLGQQITQLNGMDVFGATSAVPNGATADGEHRASVDQGIPFINPFAVEQRNGVDSPNTPTPKSAVLSLTCVCGILPNATAKRVFIEVLGAGTSTKLFSADQQLGAASGAVWSVGEESAVLTSTQWPASSSIVVNVTVTEVVGEGIKPDVSDNCESPPHFNETIRDWPGRNPLTIRENKGVLIGSAEVSCAKLWAVAPGEVQVLTLSLNKNSRDVSAANKSDEPSVSFCIIGNRS